MESPVKHIDDARIHFRIGGFTMFMPLEQAYLHIGMFLGWVIENHLYSDFFAEEGETSIFRFENKAISCIILGEVWDGVVSNEQLNKKGQDFAKYYYSSGQYIEDYKETLSQDLVSMYYVEDSLENYNRMKVVIDKRFKEWNEAEKAKKAARKLAKDNNSKPSFHRKDDKE